MERNPLCECGCGKEVALPEGRRFILGHSSKRKLTPSQARMAQSLRDGGISLVRVGRIFGVSGATINYLQYGFGAKRLSEYGGERFVSGCASEVIRPEHFYQKKSLIEGHKVLLEAKRFLKGEEQWQRKTRSKRHPSR